MADLGQQKDEEIVKQVQRGKVEPFELIVKKYQLKLNNYGRKFLNRTEDIEEIVQDVFIKAYKNINSYDASRKFSSWIYRIAHNEFINALKKKRPVYFFDLDVFLPHFISSDTLEDRVSKKETQELINKFLDKIDDKYREALILYYFDDLSYKDISDVLRIPTSTVGVRIQRAKKIMKKLYDDSCHSESR
jgi:RNA polymerase sigma-70 factor, ECF subfamily